MTTMTAQDEVNFRRKLGNGGRGFATPDLDAIWTEADGSMSKALWIAFEELMNDAARFNDYTQNDTQEKRSQIFDHIAGKLVPYWKAKAELEDTAANQEKRAVKIMGLRGVPPRRMERPATEANCEDPYRNPYDPYRRY